MPCALRILPLSSLSPTAELGTMPAPISPGSAPGPLMQVAVTTKNVPALAAYYRDVVGLRHLFDAGPNLSFFDLGGVRLMISVPSSPELDHAPSLLYYRVTDIEGVHAALK